MLSSTLLEPAAGAAISAIEEKNLGLHTAIIMDGNGRWAAARGLPRIAGHRAGVETVRRVVEAAPGLGISVLTIYAFSSDNWRRPSGEVSALMRLLGLYLAQETRRLIEQGVRLQAIGRRDRLPAGVVRLLEQAERKTETGRKLLLRVAVDYSSRQAIAAAAARALEQGGELNEQAISRALGPAVDLMIRTSGEQRLSDFLLWECAYAEMIFTERMWPDFSETDLISAVQEFRGRDRRFGGIREPALRTA